MSTLLHTRKPVTSSAVAVTPSASTHDANTDARSKLSPRDIRMVVISLMLTMFLSALDQTIVATALPTIGRELNNITDLSWTISAYLLSATAVAPVFGSLSDIYGRRTMLLTALAIFLTGSVFCALAPNMLWLILARALQGIGGGGIMPLVQTTLSDMVAPRDRGKYQVFFSTGWMVAGLSGPVLGGVIAEHLHWSFIFWINLPIGAVSLAMLIPNMKKIPVHLRPRRVDFVGGFLLMAAAVTIMLVLTWGGNTFAWMSPTIVAMLGAALLLAVTFVWHANRTPEPFLPISLLGGGVVPYAMTAVSCAIGSIVGLTVHMPLYYQVAYGLDASVAGSCLIPLAAGSVPGAALAGQMMARTRHYKRVPTAGLAVACILMTVLTVLTPLSLPVLLLLQTIVAFGCGTCFPVTTISSQNAVAKHEVGTVTGMQNFARALSASFVVALFTAILFARLGGHASLESTDLVHAVPKALLIEAYRWIFGSAAVLLGIGTVMMTLMEERPLPGRGLGKARAQIE